MKCKLFHLALCVVLFSVSTLSSEPKFEKSTSGLLYSDSTMSKFRGIVHLLNESFAKCVPPRTFVSFPVGEGNLVEMYDARATEMRAAVAGGISFDEFVLRFPKAKIEYGHSIAYIQSDSRDSNPRPYILFHSAHYTKYDVMSCKLLRASERQQGAWILGIDGDRESATSAIWITASIETKPFPPEYSRMIQYVDCLVDTNSLVYYPDGGRRAGEVIRHLQVLDTLVHEIELIAQKPEHGSGSSASYYEQLKEWEIKKRWDILDTLMLSSPHLRERLIQVSRVAIDSGISDSDFESYIGRYVSLQLSLELKRHCRVYSRCGLDRSGLYQAFEIARLAGATMKWDIFLRAHLNILNERSLLSPQDRNEKQNPTSFIRELDVLGINTADLLIGSILLVNNASSNHYTTSIRQISAALSESSYAPYIERRLVAMIADAQLDVFNRINLYTLAQLYKSNIRDKKHLLEFEASICLATSSLTENIKQRLNCVR